MLNSFKLSYSDDYRSGPSLQISEITEFESHDLVNCSETYEIEIPFTEEYQVYFLALGIGETVFEKIGPTFKQKDDAEIFAKKQYYLRTGDFPFMATGMTHAYHPKGKRSPIDINEDDVSFVNFENTDSMFREFLLISNGNYIDSHSLNPFAQW